MVNRGPSTGCNACRKRRVKCDEAKPTCRRCIRMGIECGGYRRTETVKVTFKHCTSTTIESLKVQPRRKQSLAARGSPQRDELMVIHDIPVDEESLAVGFFLSSYVTASQQLHSRHGFFDSILPILAKARPSSAVSSAFSAVATQVYSQWRHGIRRVRGLPKMRLVLALERLQATLQDPTESKLLSTLMATLLLQLLDNMASVQRLQSVSIIHQNGALALAGHLGRTSFEDPGAKYILQRLINVEVSSAIRNGRPLLADLYRWCDSDTLPKTPESDLDKIGLRIAELEHAECQVWQDHASCTVSSCRHTSTLSEIAIQAVGIDKDLIAWTSGVPSSWAPYKFNPERVRKAFPPIQTYQDDCDVYPSIQVASLWNTWRSYRLAAQTTLLACLQTYELASATDLAAFGDHRANSSSSIQVEIQNIIDSICASVPFHLGNRIGTCSLLDFSNPTLEFPACHWFLHDDFGLPDRLKHDTITPRDEHRRHVIAQGPWHIVHPLSKTLNLLSRLKVWGSTPPLREGQLSWLESQLCRCAMILGLDGERLDPKGPMVAQDRLLLSQNVRRAIARG